MTYDGEELESYTFPSQEVEFGEATVTGKIGVDYIGFPLNG